MGSNFIKTTLQMKTHNRRLLEVTLFRRSYFEFSETLYNASPASFRIFKTNMSLNKINNKTR